VRHKVYTTLILISQIAFGVIIYAIHLMLSAEIGCPITMTMAMGTMTITMTMATGGTTRWKRRKTRLLTRVEASRFAACCHINYLRQLGLHSGFLLENRVLLLLLFAFPFLSPP